MKPENKAGYVTCHVGSRTVVALPKFFDALADANFDDLPEAATGRGSVRRLCTPAGNLLLRQYRRGGLLGCVNKTCFLTASRPIREMEVTCKAAAKGLPVPLAAGAIFIYSPLPFVQAVLATEEIAGAVDLEDFALNLPDSATKIRVIEDIARAVRKMHEAGLYHADLQLKNILVRQNEGRIEVFFVDLDKSAMFDTLPERLRAANLRRLNRSAVKIQRAHPECRFIDDTDRRLFLNAYSGGDTIFGGSVDAFLRSCRRHAAIHAIGWRIFGNNKEARNPQ